MLPKALQSILDNPLVKAALFKQLTKTMKDNSIDVITLSLDAEGKMKVDAYNEPTKILPLKDFNDILFKLLNSQHGNTTD